MKNVFTLVLLAACYCVFAQPGIEYNKDFRFKEGIYLTFRQFKNNTPIPNLSIISKYNKNEINFLSKLVLKNKISYLDSAGKGQEVKTNDIWGYSNNNIVYINYEGGFNRIPIIGNICHFTAIITVYNELYETNTYDPGGYAAREFRQYILDFETGEVLFYVISNLEVILKRDQQLYDEFSALKKRQKRKSMFIYLRKYNERHPAYFGEDK